MRIKRKLATGTVVRPHVMVTCTAHISTHLQRETCINPRTDADANFRMAKEGQYERDMRIAR